MVSIYNKVAWLEGMLLKAQHFQQQERYFESLLHQHTAAQFPYYWGFSQLHLDRTLLELGKLGLKEASGIFPDGTAFKIPGLDKAPDPIEFKNSEDEAFLYLSIPLQSESQYQQDLNGEEGRYQLKELSANDTYQDTHNPQIIKICQTRLQLIFAKNPPENTPYLSVAKLNKSSEKNRVQIDESFIPPCLNIGCSQEILSACRYFIEKIKGITESISPSYKKRNSPQAALLLQYLLILKKQQALLEHHL